jgi:hypothetical protein
MELTWLMRLRIGAAAVIGVVLVGIIAWPWGNPPDPYGTIFIKSIGLNGIVTLMIMAFLAGLIAYFATWPYGKEIGILAVPFGISIWAVRAGSVSYLMQMNTAVEINIAVQRRQELLSMFQYESLFWIAVLIVGFAGVILGEKIRPAKKYKAETNTKHNKYLNPILAIIVSFVVVHISIKILAKDVIMSDNMAGYVVAQPVIGQIIFAVLVSFGLAAFIVKKLFNVTYYWPIAASVLITAFSASSYAKEQLLQHIIELWPASFFPDVIVSILPVQIVVFGALGSVAGYWMAVCYQLPGKSERK